MAGEFGLRILILYGAESRRMAQQAQSDMDRIGNAARNAASDSLAMSQRFRAVGDAMAAAGRIMTFGFTLPFMTAMGTLISEAIKFEDAFAGVLKTTEGLGDSWLELTDIGKEVRDGLLELSTTTPISPVELAGIAEVAGQFGIAEDQLVGYTEVMADLGMSTVLTAQDAAMAIARIQNIFDVATGDMASHAEHFGSALVDLGNNFATNEDEILTFATRIAATGQIAGLTEADVLAIGTAMASVGVLAEAGGTATQKVLISLMEAAASASGNVDGFTLSMIDNTDAISSAQEELDDLQYQLQLAQLRYDEMNESTLDSTRLLRTRNLEEAREAVAGLEGQIAQLVESHGAEIIITEQSSEKLEAFAHAASLAAEGIGYSAEEFAALFEEDPSRAFALFVEGLGNAGQEAFDILDTLGLKDQRLMRTFLSLAGAGGTLTRALDMSNEAWEENLALTEEAEKRKRTLASQIQMLKNTFSVLGAELLDDLYPILTKIIDGIRAMFDWFRNLDPTIKTLILAVGGIVAAMGPVLLIIGSVITAIGTLAGALVTIGPAVAAAIVALGGLGLGGGLLAGLLGAQETGFIDIPILDTIKEKIMDFAGEIWEVLEGPFKEIASLLQGAFDDFVASGVLDELIGSVRTLFGIFAEDKDTVLGVIGEIADSFVNTLGSQLPTIVGNLETIVSSLTRAIDAFGAFWAEYGDTILQVIGKVIEGGLAVATGAITLGTGLLAGQAQMRTGEYEEGVETQKDSIQTALDGIFEVMFSITNVSLEEYRQLWARGFENIVSTIIQIMHGFNKTFLLELRYVWENEILPEVSLFQLRWQAIQIQSGKIILELLRGVLRGLLAQISKYLIEIIKELEMYSPVLVDAINTIISLLINAVIDRTQEFFVLGAGIMSAFGEGASSVIDTVIGAFEFIIEGTAFTFGIHSPSTVMMGMGENVALGFAQGLSSQMSAVSDAMSFMLNPVQTMTQQYVMSPATAAVGSSTSIDRSINIGDISGVPMRDETDFSALLLRTLRMNTP